MTNQGLLQLSFIRSRQLLSSFLPSAGKGSPAPSRFHLLAEAVLVLSFPVRRLIGSFHSCRALKNAHKSKGIGLKISNFNYPFIEIRNSSFDFVPFMFSSMKLIASSGVMSARWFLSIHILCRVSLSKRRSSLLVLDAVTSIAG